MEKTKTCKKGSPSGVARVLQVKEGLDVLDKTHEENAQRAEQTDDKHGLQRTRQHPDEEIHEGSIVFDNARVEQHEKIYGID